MILFETIYDNARLIENKDKFINNLTFPDLSSSLEKEEARDEVLNFFRSHQNLEAKFSKDWQSNKFKNTPYKDFKDFIDEYSNSKSQLRKERSKLIGGDIRNFFLDDPKKDIKFKVHPFETEDWIFVSPLTYNTCIYLDSAKCGGAGAKWCIGWTKGSIYWYKYLSEGSKFVMAFNKHYQDASTDDVAYTSNETKKSYSTRETSIKYMIEVGNTEITVWDQLDNGLPFEEGQFGLTSSDFDKFDLSDFDKIRNTIKQWEVDDNGSSIIPDDVAYITSNPRFGMPDDIDDSELMEHDNEKREKLRVLDIPASVKGIQAGQTIFDGWGAFENCFNLKEVHFSDGLVEIGENAFKGCTNLEKAILPSTVNHLGEGVFAGSGLAKIKLSDNISIIQMSTFENCGNLKEVVLPKKLESIEANAFSGCFIREVKIPEGCTKIGDEAFMMCPLREVILPGSLKELSSSAFDECDELTTIYYNGTKDEWDKIKMKERYWLFDKTIICKDGNIEG